MAEAKVDAGIGKRSKTDGDILLPASILCFDKRLGEPDSAAEVK